MRTEQKYQDRQRKIRKRGKKVVGLGICVFLVLLLASQFHYEKRIQKFVLRHEEELTELAELYLESDETQKQKLLEKERRDVHGAVLTGLGLHLLPCIMDFTIHPKIFRLEPGKVSL